MDKPSQIDRGGDKGQAFIRGNVNRLWSEYDGLIMINTNGMATAQIDELIEKRQKVLEEIMLLMCLGYRERKARQQRPASRLKQANAAQQD